MPPRRLSSRNSRGRGWHKKGYRDMGDLYFQLKRSYANFSREHGVNENETITDLIRDLHRDVRGEDPRLPEHLHYEFYFRKRLLVPSEDLVRLHMDGGETVYAKASGGIFSEWKRADCCGSVGFRRRWE